MYLSIAYNTTNTANTQTVMDRNENYLSLNGNGYITSCADQWLWEKKEQQEQKLDVLIAIQFYLL